jgi:8-oxo-dGTP diphosphatase
MPKAVVVAILVNDGHVLLVRRRAPEGNLAWQFPGGAVEPSETEDQAIEREVLEEVGLKCHARRKLGERVHPDTGRTVAYWRCEPLTLGNEIVDTDELTECRWVSPPEAFELITTDVFEPVRQYLLQLSTDPPTTP